MPIEITFKVDGVECQVDLVAKGSNAEEHVIALLSVQKEAYNIAKRIGSNSFGVNYDVSETDRGAGEADGQAGAPKKPGGKS